MNKFKDFEKKKKDITENIYYFYILWLSYIWYVNVYISLFIDT